MSREENIHEIILSFINFRKGLVKNDSEEAQKLPHAQSEALFCVFHNQHVTVSELARMLNVTPGAATQLAEALVRAGYMERADDEHDRRVTKLSLSSKGETMLKAAKKAKFAKVSQILTSLDDQEVQTLATLLKKVGQSIHEQGGKK